MKEPNSIWKCAECGVILEALQPCDGGDDCIPACCGRSLVRLVENHSDGAAETTFTATSNISCVCIRFSGGLRLNPGNLYFAVSLEEVTA